jgi:TatA/E family protein of Tat protein translocase
MFGSVSFNEILLIMVLALLIFGPKRLPQIGRTIGRALGEFRRASSELKRTVEVEMRDVEEASKVVTDPVKSLGSLGDSLQTPAQSVERGGVSDPETPETS